MPILSSVVYDVSDGEKERLLKGHSEKLALAFALLTKRNGDVIRITKNLRICEDCHLVMSLVSKVEKVEIVVRDNMSWVCADIEAVVYDVIDDDKERLLKGQKLAFAFTLLTRELKIAKNR
uniref:DYW domain-containing protein n=1 Tax=Ananas comosus var. bracteatus TaxID=296719 RepID=A0A6V7P9K7_ANACO|nr:unnamed protein product [Ananas comosus var. bracteatus]